MKKCALCGQSKPLDQFPFKSKERDQRQPYCTSCNREAKAAWYRAHKQDQIDAVRERRTSLRAFVAELKEGPCVDCGGTFHPAAMDFDHKPDHAKVANLSTLVTRGVSRERLLQEIAKCDLVCANCHRIRTWQRNHAALV